MLIESRQVTFDGELPKTLGPVVVRWMERNLLHGPGDLAGRPLKIDPFWKRVLYRLYELRPDGRRLVRRALIGTPKGCAKSEIEAAIGLAELAGPVVLRDGRPSLRVAPDVPVAAVSWEQADLVFGAARAMCEPLAELLDVYDTEILRDGEAGRLYRVAAAAGSNDGRRPTCLLVDEFHEWVGRSKERVHEVLVGGLAKRDESLEVMITTAGADLDTPAGRLFEHGLKVAQGEISDPEFLFVWSTTPEEAPIGTDEQLRAALADAYPVSFVDVDWIVSQYRHGGIPEHQLRRYFLNQWVAAAGDWLPPGSWEDLTLDRGPARDGERIVIGFDGSYRRDCTAIYCWTVDDERPHGWLAGLWERPDTKTDWKVPRHEVDARLTDLFNRYEVVELVCDPYRWRAELDDWEARWGDAVLEFDTASRKRMAEACETAYAAITQRDVTHAPDPEVARHLRNCAIRDTRWGPVITKESRGSTRFIDAAVAMVIGLHRTLWIRSNRKEPDALTQIV